MSLFDGANSVAPHPTFVVPPGPAYHTLSHLLSHSPPHPQMTSRTQGLGGGHFGTPDSENEL